MDGVGAEVRKAQDEEARRRKAEKQRDKPNQDWGKSVKKTAYNVTGEIGSGLKGLFGL